MSRSRSTILVSALALSAACSGENATGPAVPVATSLTGSAATTRPAGGSCVANVGNIIVNFPTITFDLNGVCQLEHLGRATLAASETVLLLAPSFTTGIITRSGSYTAANGDVLSFTFTGTSAISAQGVAFEGTETYVSGTGRFAGVSGSVTQEGTSDGATKGQYTVKGSITF